MEQTAARAPSSDDVRCVGCGDAPRVPLSALWCGAAGRWLHGGAGPRPGAARPGLRRPRRRGSRVALKELQFATVPSVQELDAFEREADALRTLHHPGIPAYVGRFREGQGVGLAAVPGLRADRRRDAGRAHRPGSAHRAPRRAALADTLLDILGYLHGQSSAGAAPRSQAGQRGAPARRDAGPGGLRKRPHRLSADRTHGSTLVGTFGYMPPEQLGGTVDRTSDLYALGATLLHALTGRPPGDWLGRVAPAPAPRRIGGAVRHLAPTAARGGARTPSGGRRAGPGAPPGHRRGDRRGCCSVSRWGRAGMLLTAVG